mgnify:CR=1 FL=1
MVFVNSNTREPLRASLHKRSAAALLCVLATSLCSNTCVVQGFAPSTIPSPVTTSSTGLDVSSVISVSHSDRPSFVERMGNAMTAAVASKKQRKQVKQQREELQSSFDEKPTHHVTVTTMSNEPRSPQTSSSSAATAPLLRTNILLDEQEVLRRKREWATKYTSVESLRATFGGNKNRLWGDMQASTARRLYKTLLPRALLELSQLGVGELQPQDLAPLAYQARVAAKLYARERCTVPARLGATLFDGFRQWMKYGKFQAHGMTYDQLWEKYAEKIIHETENPEVDICLKIIERSCISNSKVDSLVLSNPGYSTVEPQQKLLEQIHSRLEQDMYELLLPNVQVSSEEGELSTSGTSSSGRKLKAQRRPWCKRNHMLIVRLLAKQKRLIQLQEEQAQAARMEQLHP